MGSTEPLDDGSLMVVDPRDITDPPNHNYVMSFGRTCSANPLPAEQTVLSLQSKGAPLNVSHKADVASSLIRGGGVSALNQKKKREVAG